MHWIAVCSLQFALYKSLTDATSTSISECQYDQDMECMHITMLGFKEGKSPKSTVSAWYKT